MGPIQACVVAKGAAAMDTQVLETTLKAYISEMRDRIEQAAGIAKGSQRLRRYRQHRQSHRDCA